MDEEKPFYTDYREAHAAAARKANRTGKTVILRRVEEWGKTGYTLSLACITDSNRGEHVYPTKGEA